MLPHFALSFVSVAKWRVQFTKITTSEKMKQNNSSQKSFLSAVKSVPELILTLRVRLRHHWHALSRHEEKKKKPNQAANLQNNVTKSWLLVNAGLCFYCLALAWTFMSSRAAHSCGLHSGKHSIVDINYPWWHYSCVLVRPGTLFLPDSLWNAVKRGRIRINCKSHNWLI